MRISETGVAENYCPNCGARVWSAMREIKLTKRFPESRPEDITEAYMRGYEAGRGVRETFEIEKGTVDTAGWWVCKSCGTPFDMIGALACMEKKKPNYCPGCGRKVVSE